ncbi:LysR family transcriptional regulator [Secundilactobacillus folii]|uniref:LysR family transcriptional regulator n=1 Tax=Secundilactobacillus folii TaxID=2678357 RepID=A0A7X2XW20_9LACO|nr:LysR family transcriptional regulator [Secundilactobacillus folii]MTV82668.1 LysR family transcriptional regulator [Secundilactobacillus folii]
MATTDSKTMLIYLDKLIEYSNFTKAANALYISQPYLTQLIQKVEGRLGVTIINRHSGSFQLTEAGQIYYDYLEKLEENELELSQNLSRFTTSAEAQTIKIGVLSTLGTSLLPQFLPSFFAKHPETSVLIDETEPHKNEKNVIEGKTDFYVGQNPENVSPNLITETGSTWQYCAIIPKTSSLFVPNTKLLKSGSISMKRLLQEKLVLTANGSAIRRQVNYLFKKFLITPNIVVESTNIFTTAHLSMRGAGVAIVPQKILNASTDYNIYPISKDLIDIQFFIAFSENKILTRADKDLLSTFKRTMKTF